MRINSQTRLLERWLANTAWPFLQFIATYLRDQVLMQRERLFLWMPVVIALGIGVYFALPFEPPLALGLFAFLFSLSFFTLSYPKRHDGSGFYGFLLLGAVMALMSAGFLASQLRTAAVYTPMLVDEVRATDVIGTVEMIEPLEEGAGSRITLSNLYIEDLAPEDTPKRVRLRLRKDGTIAAGQRVKLLAGLTPPFSPVYPGAFDFQRYAYFKGIGAVGFVYNEPEIISVQAQKSWNLFWERLRLSINHHIESHMPYPESALAQALITGKRKAISEEEQQAIRDAGLAHMLAISGLHVGLVSAVIFFIVRLLLACFPSLALRMPIKKIAALAAFFGALFYTLMVGAPITTQRAMMMTGVVLIAIILDRSAISLRLVALAAIIVLLFAPESLMSASFQMSFAAVVALVAFYEMLRPQLSAWYSQAGMGRKMALYFMGVCMTTIIASLATAPFSLFHFQNFASLGLLGNLVAVPLMAFIIMPVGVLSLALMPFGLEGLTLPLMQWGINQVLEISYYVAGMPNAVAHSVAWPTSALLWIVAAGIFAILWKGKLKALAMIMFSASFFIIYHYNQYDIYISSSHKLIGFKDENGALYVSSRRSDQFVLENWERANGQEEGSAETWPKEGRGANNMRCGPEGCRLRLKGTNIAFSKMPMAHTEDCNWADIVITNDVLGDKECGAHYVIDKIDTWKNGAQAVLLGKDQEIKVHASQDFRGKRPWVIRQD